MKRFTENDDVLNAVSALDLNSPFFLLTKMLITLSEKYSLPLPLDMVRLKSQVEVARNTSLADERPTTSMQRVRVRVSTVKGAAGISDLLALIKVILTIPVASASADHSF